MNFKNRSVGDIVAENYEAAGVFRQYGIDFCCGGGQLLSVICEKKGVNAEDIQEDLEKVYGSETGSGENYSDWSPSFLIDYIENTHHTFVRKKTEEITSYAAKVARVHGETHPENKDIYWHFTELAGELIDHLESEENTVFPLIKSLESDLKEGRKPDPKKAEELRMELDQMEEEHETAGRVMEKIGELSNRFTPPAGACATYRILYQNLEGFEKDLHKHVHLENNILFKKAEALLG
ncbi:MAG: iron-sulfur cluster repair di-iron protein [Balneolaceae bacterium]|nr:iron-sulfur cluster repair di-iron protein [Balneolaceae bacterium]